MMKLIGIGLLVLQGFVVIQAIEPLAQRYDGQIHLIIIINYILRLTKCIFYIYYNVLF